MKKRILILAGILSLTMATPAFAGATNSFSVGESDIPSKDSPTGYIDTSENAPDVARNLVYAGYTPIIAIENVGRNAVTADRLNSGVDFLAGHGDENTVYWKSFCVTNYPASVEYPNISNINISNCKLAILASCHSADSTNGIANSFRKSGAKCAIGWRGVVGTYALADFTTVFTKHLADGLTIQQALREAKAELEGKLNAGSNVFEYEVYGSGTSSIKRNRDSAVDNEALEYLDSISKKTRVNDIGRYDPETYVRPTSTFVDIKNEGIVYQNGDDTQIVRYIQENVDNNFDKSLYRVEEFSAIPGDDSMMLIIYRYKVGDVVSDFGYMFNVENHQVLGYKEMGTRLYDYPMASVFSINDMKEEALQKYNAETDNTDKIVEQTAFVEFDSEAKEYIYSVTTGYEAENGGQYGLTTEYRQIGDTLVER